MSNPTDDNTEFQTPPTPPTMDERRAAVMAFDFSSLEEADDGIPTIPTQDEQPQEPQNETVVELDIPDIADLEKFASSRRDDRVTKEQAEADARDAAEYRRLKQEGKLDAQPGAKLTNESFIELFRSLPPKERTAILRGVVNEVRSPDSAAVERNLRAKIEDLESKIVDPNKIVKQTREQIQAEQAQAQLESDFQAVAGDSERFPHLAGLKPEHRLSFAYETINLYREYDRQNGTQTSLNDELLAASMEKHLASRAQPKPNPAPQAPAVQEPQEQTPAAVGTTEPKGEPQGTLNDLAASAPVRKPRTMAEKKAYATQWLKHNVQDI